MALAWRASDPRGSAGSNPALPAISMEHPVVNQSPPRGSVYESDLQVARQTDVFKSIVLHQLRTNARIKLYVWLTDLKVKTVNTDLALKLPPAR